MVTAARVSRSPAGRGADPFVKWAGGKRQLVPDLLEAAPAKIATYFEPFLGGGALFFALHRHGRFQRAVLADANRELIECYGALRDDVDGVIEELHRFGPTEKEYYAVRALDPATLIPARRAARLIYLNKVGFNGLYRVNSKGKFNVPFGRHRRPVICDEPRLRAVAGALRGKVKLVCKDFARAVETAKPGDFVYFDPPYVPVSATAYFTAYGKTLFGREEQERLAATLRKLGERGVPALLSNSDCAETRRLYEGLVVDEVQVRRAINSVATRRGPVGELLVKNFPF